VGEEVVAELANTRRRQFIEALKLPPHAIDWQHVESVNTFAYPHCQLSPLDDCIFDGQHQIDVALWIRPKSALALELKLGKTGLGAKTFNKNFLSDCDKSHKRTRIKGTMIAILERLSPHISAGRKVSVLLDRDTSVTLAPKWGLVVQQSVLNSWARRGRPALSGNVLTISIKHLVNACYGREGFNKLVTKLNLLPRDCYDSWLLG
jgi:hypothetical protein